LSKPNDPSRDLLFGLLALQNGLIDQGGLFAAFAAWTRDKARSLADHFVDLGHLDAARRAVFEAIAGLHVQALDRQLGERAVVHFLRGNTDRVGRGADLVGVQHRQEALCRAYVRAIAAQAGLICSEPEEDYGIDLCLRAIRGRGPRLADVGGVIEFVTDLALAEGRYAVEVLNEVLQEQLETSAIAGDGPRVKSRVH